MYQEQKVLQTLLAGKNDTIKAKFVIFNNLKDFFKQSFTKIY